jgi:hydroxyacylglutathione hydrolase
MICFSISITQTHMNQPLEDSYNDVLRKALWSLRLEQQDLTRPTGLTLDGINAIFSGNWSDAAGFTIARSLGLRGDSLAALACGTWRAPSVSAPAGLEMFVLPFEDSTVNSYLVWDSIAKEAALFDTGPNASEALMFCSRNSLRLNYLFLTHTHTDHILDLDKVVDETGCQVVVHRKEAIARANPFSTPRSFQIGSFTVEARHTWGHSFGGVSYVVQMPTGAIAIVGDAIFAGSIGRPLVSYRAALDTIETEIFSLPDPTILCPGHGPLTTVGHERAFNPFFP